MKASKIIEKLKEIIKEHGDLDCGYSDDCRDVTVSKIYYDVTWEDIKIS